MHISSLSFSMDLIIVFKSINSIKKLSSVNLLLARVAYRATCNREEKKQVARFAQFL